MLEVIVNRLQFNWQISGKVQSEIEKNQREYFLNEQLKVIHKERDALRGTDSSSEHESFYKEIDQSLMPLEDKEKAFAELDKLKLMPPLSAEAAVVRSWLKTLLSVPRVGSKENVAVKGIAKVLESAMHGLKDIKERIQELGALHKRAKGAIKGPILCLVGPPGVGKTSLGRFIAQALGREFVSMSLGGVRDVAEIHGHRRTYIGSMSGGIIQGMIRAGVNNPVFMLDEIDKLTMDYHGNPSAALLPVLDPEQNTKFRDHYLDVDYDLSKVLFVATANTLTIPLPLLDRMEIIRIPGYTEFDKMQIAKGHLIPKQKKEHCLKAGELEITANALRDIIRYYTREAGVRNLQREIAKLCRKVLTEREIYDETVSKSTLITPRKLEKYLGVRQFRYGLAEQHDQIGCVKGLAWTEVGGELLTIESSATTVFPGKGKTHYTGQLGDIMQESIDVALTVIREHAERLGIATDFHETNYIHIHVPDGATPKDGPSAGIGMCIALISALAKIPVCADVAMTGEITLRGDVLKIGGLKEKLLAALRGDICRVIIPKENESELQEIPEEIKKGLMIYPVSRIDEVLKIALRSSPMRAISTSLPITDGENQKQADSADNAH
jgi:ATP-dependent Lon protease